MSGPRGLSDSGRFYRDGGKATSFSAIFRYMGPAMRLEMAKKRTRFPARLAELLNPTGCHARKNGEKLSN